jgi:hypothetical protein
MKLKLKHKLRLWRILNTLLIFMAMAMNWYEVFNIDDQIGSYDSLFGPEWPSFIGEGIYSFKSMFIYGVDMRSIQSILLGISEPILVLYPIYNLLVLLNKRKEYKSQVLIPIALIIMIIVFSSELQYVVRPLLGFWVISLGLLSSAVLEWVNARSADTQPVE